MHFCFGVVVVVVVVEWVGIYNCVLKAISNIHGE